MTKLKISAGKIKTIEDCLLKFKYSFIDKKKINKQSDSWQLSYYSSIIDTLKKFFQNNNFKELDFESLKSLFYNNWKSKGYSDKNFEQSEKNNAVKIIKEIYDDIIFNKNRIQNTFSFFNFVLQRLVDITVFVHRIDKLDNGNYEIIIYKTGKVPNYEYFMENDIDSAIFQIAFDHLPEFSGHLEKITYYYIRSNQKLSIKHPYQKIKYFKTRIIEAAYLNTVLISNSYNEELRNKLFNYVSSPEIKYLDLELLHKGHKDIGNKNYMCKWCDYFTVCESWENEVHSDNHKNMPAYSYSKIGAYKDCPYVWKKRYIDRVPSKPKPFFDFGHAIHSTFEIFFSPKHKIEWDYEALLELYEYFFNNFQNGYKDEEQKSAYYEDGLKMINTYYNRYIKDLKMYKAYDVEKYFEVPINNKFLLNGFIDRIDKLKDETYEVLDYKTEPTLREQSKVDKDEQLSIYYWVLKNIYKMTVSKLSLLMLKFDKKIVTERQDEDMKGIIKDMIDTVNEIENKKDLFEKKKDEKLFQPKINKYCLGCDFLDNCPLKEEIKKANLDNMDFTQ
jgi:putative RecB family exonuclease